MQVDSSAAQKSFFRKWAPLVIMSLALAIIIIDTTVLNVSLRNIIHDFNADIHKIQWVVTAYSLILAAFTITGGRLGDLFGRKKMFVIGAIIFAAGSIITALSNSVGMMLVGNAVIEGIGACLMMPATSALLLSNYQGRDRSLAFGVWGGIIAASAAIGPVLGGWLTTNYSWRWAFGINPIVVIVILAGIFLIHEARDTESKPGLDFGGIILSSLGLLSVAFGFIQASVFGWWNVKDQLVIFSHTINLGSLSATPVFIALGIIILAIFAFYEKYITSKGKTPLVNLSLFKNQQFVVGATIAAILALGQTGIFFSIPVFLQAVKNLDPLHTGLAMLPMSVAILITAPTSSFLSKFISPKRLIQAGLVINIIGFLVLRNSLTVDVSTWGLLPGFALFGIGMGLIFAQVSNVALSAVPLKESGEASGVNNTMRQVGATMGAAIMGAILISSLSTNLANGVNKSTVIPDSVKPQISQAVSEQSSGIEFGGGDAISGQNIPEAIKTEITSLSHQATTDANKKVILFGIIFIAIGLLVSELLPTHKDLENSHNGSAEHADEEVAALRTAESRRSKTIVLGIALLVLGGAVGFAIGKHNENKDVKTDAVQTAIPSQPEIVQTTVSPEPVVNEVPQPDNMEQTKDYSNNVQQFSVALPIDWVVSQSDKEVVISSKDGANYSVQMYVVNSDDITSLKTFLDAQSNMHGVTDTIIAGHQGFMFTIDGEYKGGFAFLDNGRLYYMLGTGVENTAVASSFKAK